MSLSEGTSVVQPPDLKRALLRVARVTIGDRVRGALVGVAVGDALGASFEGRPGPFSPDLDALTSPLPYTDDTHMTIGLAQHLLEEGDVDQARLALHFARRYQEEPWRGYGAGPPRVFDLVAQSVPWDEAAGSLFGGRGSFGNGGAMRAAPAGVLAAGDPERAADLGRRQAAVTHRHPLGEEGAAILAAAVARVLVDPHLPDASLLGELGQVVQEGVFREALEAIERLLPRPSPHEVVEELGNGIEAHRSVPTAICAFLQAADFRAALTFALGLGGDTDTIGAMTCALAGARYGLSGIPEQWVEVVEGTSELRDLADRLADVGRRRTPGLQ